MRNLFAIDEHLFGQLRNVLERAGIYGELIEPIIMGITENGTKGRAPDFARIAGGFGRFTNAIPSSDLGPCTEELLVCCFDRDNLDVRLREMVYHAGIFCRENRRVVFLTTKWDPKVFANHARAIEELRGQGREILFILLTAQDADGSYSVISIPV